MPKLLQPRPRTLTSSCEAPSLRRSMIRRPPSPARDRLRRAEVDSRVAFLAYVPEGLAHLAHEGLGLLEGREVAAAGELAEVDQLAEALLGPAPRGAEDLLREDAAAGRDQ